MSRKVILGAAVAAIAVAIPAVPAYSADAAPAARLMTQSELQPFGGVKRSTWFVDPLDTKLPNALCSDAAGKQVLFPNAPGGWMASGQVNAKGYVEVTEIVHDYGSADKAQSAWNALAAATASCAPKTRTVLAVGNPKEYYNVTQFVSNTTDLVTVQERSVAVSADKRINKSSSVTYTSFRPAGNAIIQAFYYDNGGKKVSATVQNNVDDLSAELATRWTK